MSFEPHDAPSGTLAALDNTQRALATAAKYAALTQGTGYLSPKSEPLPIITLRFDDGYANTYSIVFPLLKARGLPAFHPINLNQVSDAPGHIGARCSIAQIKEMQDTGIPAVNHSRTHLDPNTTNPADPWSAFLDETVTHQADMLAQQLWSDVFVQPGSWQGDEYQWQHEAAGFTRVGQILRAYFGAAYMDDQDDWYWPIGPLPPQHLYGSSYVGIENTPIATSQGYLDSLEKRGGWLNINIHTDVLNTGGPAMTTANVTTFLDDIVARRDAGRLVVLSALGAMYAQPIQPVNFIRDADLSLAVAGTFKSWIKTLAPTFLTASAGTSPFGVAVNYLHVDLSNYAQQFFVASEFRSMTFTAFVRGTDGVARTPKLIWRQISSDGATTYIDRFFNSPTTVTNADVTSYNGWTKFRCTMGTDPRGGTFMIWPYSASGGIEWCLMNMTKN